jgi:tetratricopeptide (TPR) repeat protein
MNRDVSSFIERYQLLYEKDPNSKVFAPLAEAYRRMGLVDEAIDLAEKGVARHPNFASGRVALGKCYAQKSEFEKAVEQLKNAVELSPENLLAHQLLADCYMQLKRPTEALNAYKMVLFLNPNDTRVAGIAKSMEEKLYGGSYKDSELNVQEEYAMGPLSQVLAKNSEQKKQVSKQVTQIELDRELALLDARFDRGDWPTGKKQLEQLLKKFPKHPDVLARKHYLDELTQNTFSVVDWLEPLPNPEKSPKIGKLKELLERVEARRKA